jgi:hypothetical protein
VLAKLTVLVLGIAVCAGALLAARQMRMQAAHELTEARLRVMKHDNELFRLRAQIAGRITPEQIEQMATEVAPLKSIASDIPPPLVVGSGGAGVQHP